jgi:hypothetical protein
MAMTRHVGLGDPIAVLIEAVPKRAFAAALDWPGWVRPGRDEATALSALASYAARYRDVAALAGEALPATAFKEASDGAFEIAERLEGTATTSFGAPDRVATADVQPIDEQVAARLAALVEAAWTTFDRVAAGAPSELRKGPRGGGRDRDDVARHVLAAETAYIRKLGLRLPEPAFGDAAALAGFRLAVLDVMRRPSDGGPVIERGWPVRYAARRIAWHVLDHAWEIEDKSEPAP